MSGVMRFLAVTLSQQNGKKKKLKLNGMAIPNKQQIS